MNRTLEDPYYYLQNFQRVLAWIAERYDDLLLDEERTFLADFSRLPRPSQALLVRMVMRKGELFRASKLNYAEIGDAAAAAEALLAAGWIEADPVLDAVQLGKLLTKAELDVALGEMLAAQGLKLVRKGDMLAALAADPPEPRRYSAWHTVGDDQVYQLKVMPLCERFRLMFFGNLHQDWSEFVLADLGIYQYERVALAAETRGFQQRCDIDTYLHLSDCRRRLQEGEALPAVLADIPVAPLPNEWLEARRSKLLHGIALAQERQGELEAALNLYTRNPYPGARARAVRVLERLERHADAHALVVEAMAAPESEQEAQQLPRVLPRLRRKLGLPKPAARAALPLQRLDLCLPRPEEGYSVEFMVRDHLSADDAPVHYVENTLINSLFGLLCWEAVFAPLPGAFFHPFHRGPADLHSPDFVTRRTELFERCLAQLDGPQYLATIRLHYRDKWNLQSPFVFWGLLDEALLEQALACLPPAHLRHWFRRMLADLPGNRSGLPDLIQFYPQTGAYRLIEVKGPGDRLQDNQLRWLDYCLAHDIPVCVCYVQWAEAQG
ncbi:PDDEXK family nuclease [Chitinimonas naiadis]